LWQSINPSLAPSPPNNSASSSARQEPPNSPHPTPSTIPNRLESKHQTLTMPPAGMAPPVPDAESSPAPTVNKEKTPAEPVEAGVAVAVQEGAMEVDTATAVEEPDEVEPEEDAGAEPQEATATGAESDDEAEDDPDEDPGEEEEDDENPREEAEAAVKDGSDEATVMEPLAVVKPGEVQEEEDGSEETEEDEDEESEEDEDEEANKGVEEGGDVEDGTKGSVDVSPADHMNEIPQGEHDRRVNKNKDKIADQLINDSDAGGSSGDVQNSELAGALEIMVDELPKDCVEEDVAVVFSECGEIKSVRIIRNSSTEKSKDIAFICYASIEAANKALTEFKEGIEVKGIKVRVSACQDNNTLYLGNICKSWTEDQVLATLNNIGIQECEISLPPCKGRNRGFAFLKFKSHYYARAAFRRLMKPDAIFGADGSVRVSFYRKPTKPSDDLMEAKRVYLEHVPLSWNEDKVKECCEGYGKILKIDLFQISKNMKSEMFSFVEFVSSKNALACVEGINDANIVDGAFKLSACLARPKNGATSEGATSSKKEDDEAKKFCVDKNSLQKLPKGNKSRLTSSTKEVVVKKNAPSKLPRGNDRKRTSQEAAEEPQTSKSSEGERKLGKNKNTSVNQRQSKKARNNRNVDGSNLTYQSAAVLQTSNPSTGKRKLGKNRNTHINERPLKIAHNNSTVRQPRRTRGTGQPAGPASNSRTHHSLGGSSRSKAYASDLEPHAGYIPPANQVHSTNAYHQRRTAQYDLHPIDAHPYARETALSRSTYSDYTSRAQYQTGYEYIYPPPPTSESYYTGRGLFIPRRGE
ncbi:hypothetical protein EJB05_22869, partial [Eragrostis curvula]